MTDSVLTAPAKFRADDPYHPLDPTISASKHASVRDLLGAVERQPAARGFHYRYAWYEIPAVSAALWIAGSTFLVGGVWPVTSRLLTGAGFGRQQRLELLATLALVPKPKHDWKKEADEALAKLNVVLDLIAYYEWQLREGEPGAPLLPLEKPLPAAIQRLTALPDVTAFAPPEETNKAFGGEFYPTETHAPEAAETEAAASFEK